MKIIDYIRKIGKESMYAFMYNKEAKTKAFYNIAEMISRKYKYTDLEELREVLTKKGEIYVKYLPNSRGEYSSRTKDIYITYIDFGRRKDPDLTHEAIHKINENINKRYKKEFKMNQFYLEATIDRIVSNALNIDETFLEKSGCTYLYISKDTTYPFEYAIAKQIDFIIGRGKFEKDVLTGGKERAEEQFEQRYGKGLNLEIIKRMRKINRYEEIEDKFQDTKFIGDYMRTKIQKEFSDLQNEIMLMCFEKDYENIRTTEDIIKYIYKLKEFEFMRGRVENDTINGKNRDYMYEEYYERKRLELQKLWKEKTDEELPKELHKKPNTEVDFSRVKAYEGNEFLFISNQEESYIRQIQNQKKKYMTGYLLKSSVGAVKRVFKQSSLDER